MTVLAGQPDLESIKLIAGGRTLDVSNESLPCTARHA